MSFLDDVLRQHGTQADAFREYLHSGVLTTAERHHVATSPFLCRLGLVRQLNIAHLVCHPSAASYTRLGHSVMAMGYAERIARALYPSLARHSDGCPPLDVVVATARAAALYHDSGHEPWSHTLEDFGPRAIDHELVGRAVVCHTPEAQAIASHLQVDAAVVAYLVAESDMPGFTAPWWAEILKCVLFWYLSADNLAWIEADQQITGHGVGFHRDDAERVIAALGISDGVLGVGAEAQDCLIRLVCARLGVYMDLSFHPAKRRLERSLSRVSASTIGDLRSSDICAHVEDLLTATDPTWTAAVLGADVPETLTGLDDRLRDYLNQAYPLVTAYSAIPHHWPTTVLCEGQLKPTPAAVSLLAASLEDWLNGSMRDADVEVDIATASLVSQPVPAQRLVPLAHPIPVPVEGMPTWLTTATRLDALLRRIASLAGRINVYAAPERSADVGAAMRALVPGFPTVAAALQAAGLAELTGSTWAWSRTPVPAFEMLPAVASLGDIGC